MMGPATNAPASHAAAARMSGAAAPQATGAAPVSEPSVHRNGPRTCWSSLPEALRAEWTKLLTLPGTPWLLAAFVTLTVAVSTVATAAVTCPAGGCTVDPARTSLTGIYLGQALAAVLGVLVIGSEYSTSMIRTTFTAMPRRTTVLAAKAVNVAGLLLAAGAVAVAGSLLAGRILLAGHGITPAHGYPALTLADGPVLRAAAGSVLYLTLIALLSLGTATIIRDPAPAIGTVLGLLYLDPIIAAVLHNTHWHNAIQRYAPMSAGLAIQATTNLHGLPISPWGGLGVLAAWAGAALLTGGLLLRLRDT
jgi:ABC-2 type transport system permease protein